MSDVLPGNCSWGATREPAHCCGATSKSGFPTVQASSCVQLPSNALKLPGTTVCLPSDHVVQIHDGQCLSHQKTQPTAPWSLTDTSVLFWSRRPFPHPLRRLHLGLNIIPINPRLISCYDVLQKVFITIYTGKQFLTDFNMVLFLIVIQQPRHEFCTDAKHLKFFSKTFDGKILCWCPPRQQILEQLTLRWLMSYIYGAPILDVSRSHTTTQHSR